MKGTVVKFDQTKGYGFIRAVDFENTIFVHIKNVRNADVLERGQQVEFDISRTQKGLSAISVIAGRKQKSPSTLFAIFAVLLIFCLAVFLGRSMNFLVAYVVAINLTTIIIYAYDKLIAGTSRLRVPENILHGLALMGGSPSALLAQRLFRHKTIKGSFQKVYWSIVGLQALLVIILANV